MSASTRFVYVVAEFVDVARFGLRVSAVTANATGDASRLRSAAEPVRPVLPTRVTGMRDDMVDEVGCVMVKERETKKVMGRAWLIHCLQRQDGRGARWRWRLMGGELVELLEFLSKLFASSANPSISRCNHGEPKNTYDPVDRCMCGATFST
jgi:hypothetical protein